MRNLFLLLTLMVNALAYNSKQINENQAAE